MAIDPMIANPSGLKLNDPMEQYNNYLLAATRQGEMRKAKREEESLNALNAAFAVPGAINPDGSYNLGVISNALAKSGIGSAIPGQYEQHLKNNKLVSEAGLLGEQANTQKAEQALKGSQVKETEAKTATEQGKAFEQAWNNHRQLLSGINTANPAEGFKQYGDWLKAAFNNDTLRQGLESRGMTPDSMIEQLQSHMKSHTLNDLIARTTMGMEAASERQYVTENLGGHSTITSLPKNPLGNTKGVVVSDQQMTPDPNAAARAPKMVTNLYNNTVLGIPATNAFQDKAGGVVGEDFGNSVKANRGFEQQVAGIDRALDILDSGAVITGAGAKPKLDIVRVAKALGANVDDKMLQNTELLSQQIATSVFNRIATLKSQGVALTPMSNTDLAKIEAAGPQAWNDPGTLKRLFLYEREAVQNARRLFNDQVKHYKQTPETANAVRILGADVLPDIKPRQTGIPQGAIDKLRKNPHLAGEFDKKYGKGAAARVLNGRQ